MSAKIVKTRCKKIGLLAIVIMLIVGMINIPVFNVTAAKVKLSKTKITLKVSQKKKLKVKGAKGKITWKSKNRKIATVKKGVVTGKKRGKTIIIAKTNNKKLKCKVTVKNNDNKVTDIIPPIQNIEPTALQGIKMHNNTWEIRIFSAFFCCCKCR